MSKIGIFVGSSTGSTMAVAEQIAEGLEGECDLIDLEDDYMDPDQFLEYDVLILGCSTWGSGEVQFNWVEPIQEFKDQKPDFTGKLVALFGAGDYKDHGEQFVSALGVLYDFFKGFGAEFIGAFPIDGYTFEYSNAVRDGRFVGLPFDRVNEPEKTSERVSRWLEVVNAELPVSA